MIKTKYLYNIFSLAIVCLLIWFISASPFIYVNKAVTQLPGAPRRYYDYSDDLKSLNSIITLPYLFELLLYVVVQVFVLSSVKRFYGGFKKAKVIIYILAALLVFPVLLIPSLAGEFQFLFLTGLNPFLGKLILLPVYYQIWVWIDIIIRMIVNRMPDPLSDVSKQNV